MMKPHLSCISIMAFASIAAAPPSNRALLKEGSITAGDYPSTALAARQEGTVVAAFLIAARGDVTKCQVAQTSGSDALDARTCEIIVQRFRYDPARSSSGLAVEEWRTQKISWKLPTANDRYASATRKAELLVDIGRDGTVDGCEVLKPSGDPKWDLEMCTSIASNHKFEPARDTNGRSEKSRRVVPVWE